MPKPQFYLAHSPAKQLYIQIRPYTDCNDSLLLLIGPDETKQIEVNLPKEEFQEIRDGWKSIHESEFRKIQEEFFLSSLKMTWDEIYDKYYALWKKYFSNRRISVSNTRDSNPYDYYSTLETEYHKNGVYVVRKQIQSLENEIAEMENPSIMDVFKEARVGATHQYNIGKI